MANATPLFSIQVNIFLYAAILGLISQGTFLHAELIAHFSEGTGASTPDQFEGTPGAGWGTKWLTQKGADGTTTFSVMTPSDSNYAPLNRGENYLQIDYIRTGITSNVRAGIARRFNITEPEGIDLTKPYEIYFAFRLDKLTGFSSSADQILFSTENETVIRDSKAAAPWYLWIRGDEGFSVQNGNGNGEGTRINLTARLGLTVETGVVYSVTVYLNPADFSYDLAISNGLTTYRASDANNGNPLGFRTKTLEGDAPNVFQARLVNDRGDDHFTMSFGNLSIVPKGTMPKNRPSP